MEEEEISNLLDTWIFYQLYIGAPSVTMSLKQEKGKGWVTYEASGSYGVITLVCTVHSDRSVNLSLNALNGACGAFSGVLTKVSPLCLATLILLSKYQQLDCGSMEGR